MGSKLRAHYGKLARQRNSVGPIQNMVVEPYILIHQQTLKTPRKEITSPNIPKVEKNISPLKLLQNKNTEPIPITNYVRQEIKNKPNQQIKERPPVSQIRQEPETEKPIDKNSLANKAKGVSVNKKIQEQTLKGKSFNIGKDSLRI